MVILLLICGCIPKLGALANIIPLPVLGGAMIAMFGWLWHTALVFWVTLISKIKIIY